MLHRSFTVVSVAAWLVLAGLSACSPTFNWRDVRFDGSPVQALLPCKPDKAERTVPMAGQPVVLSMQGCEAGGLLFSVAVAQLPRVEETAVTLQQWRLAMLASARAGGARDSAFVVPGAAALPPAHRVAFQGQRPDGSAVQGEALFFSHGSQVFQAAVLADKIDPEAVNTFFAGIRLP